MLRSDTSKRLWIQTETGEFEPVESHSQIHSRKRGPGRGGFGGLGGIVESDGTLDGWGDFVPPKRGRGSRLGDLIRAEQRRGQGRGSVFARGAGPGKSLLADAGTVLQDGSEARPAPAGPALSPPPAQDKETRLIWSQSRGTLETVEGVFLGQGYSGAGGPNEKGAGRNNPSREGEKDVGPIPQGNWRVEKITDDSYRSDLTRPIFRLVPLDDGTRERVQAMGRDPNTFLIHGNNDEDNASSGCIILDKPKREKLAAYNTAVINVGK